ncbi:MAG: universal stress protein [Kiloniellales bacterium]|nr:universal stress protein [Kiloniellales bacterium]
MTAKRILLPICTPELPLHALEAAIVVAQEFAAHLAGVQILTPHAEPKRFARSELDPRHYTELASRFISQEHQDALATRKAFEEFLSKRNMRLSNDPIGASYATASWQEITGDPGEVVAIYGGAFELIVLSHPKLAPASAPSSVLEAAVFGAAQPVLLAYEGFPAAQGQSILIAWNRGVQIRRAVSAALPFLERAESAVIVNIETGAKRGPEPEEIAATLAWHGVSAEVKRIAPDRRSVGEILVEEAREAGANLLVMGAYSQNRMREKLIGGVTKEILVQSDFSVFMAR